jgi:hypothetical protein
MRDYGSEVSETSMPPRKSFVQHASVVRQFRRWNPNFHEWFELADGVWRPKLGKAGELQRRDEARRSAGQQRKKQKTSADDVSTSASDRPHEPNYSNSTSSSSPSDSTQDRIKQASV